MVLTKRLEGELGIRVLSLSNHNYTGEPAGRASSRRAALYRQRARELGERAARETFADRRKFMLDLAATYMRAADAIAPQVITEADPNRTLPRPATAQSSSAISSARPKCCASPVRNVGGMAAIS